MYLNQVLRLLNDLTRARSRWKGRKRGQQVRPESVPFGERKTIAVRPRSTTETTKRKIYEMDIFKRVKMTRNTWIMFLVACLKKHFIFKTSVQSVWRQYRHTDCTEV
jgi:hypothetical protein